MDDDRRRAPREKISARVEFALDSHDVLEADALDLSAVGVGFETDEPLTVALTITSQNRELTTKHARLVRVTRNDDGTFVFGLEFVE